MVEVKCLLEIIPTMGQLNSICGTAKPMGEGSLRDKEREGILHVLREKGLSEGCWHCNVVRREGEFLFSGTFSPGPLQVVFGTDGLHAQPD